MRTGIDVMIHPTAEIIRRELVSIGNHVGIDMGVYISTKALIGDYVHIAPHACVIGGVAGCLVMEDFTNISAGAKIVVVSDSFTEGMLNPIVPVKCRKLVGLMTYMRRFSAIGVNSVVLPGVEMAIGSVLAAGSVLTKSTEAWGVYVGSPAKLVRYRDSEMILKSAKELGYEY